MPKQSNKLKRLLLKRKKVESRIRKITRTLVPLEDLVDQLSQEIQEIIDEENVCDPDRL